MYCEPGTSDDVQDVIEKAIIKAENMQLARALAASQKQTANLRRHLKNANRDKHENLDYIRELRDRVLTKGWKNDRLISERAALLKENAKLKEQLVHAKSRDKVQELEQQIKELTEAREKSEAELKTTIGQLSKIIVEKDAKLGEVDDPTRGFVIATEAIKSENDELKIKSEPLDTE